MGGICWLSFLDKERETREGIGVDEKITKINEENRGMRYCRYSRS
jgi:hypothetical protein